MLTKFSNFVLSGQKWALAPESIIAPRLDAGTLSCSAMLTRMDVSKVTWHVSAYTPDELKYQYIDAGAQ
jgi:hypothetical protein